MLGGYIITPSLSSLLAFLGWKNDSSGVLGGILECSDYQIIIHSFGGSMISHAFDVPA